MKKQIVSITRLTSKVAFALLAMSGAAFAQTGAVPEIDAGSAASALTLVIGAGLFLKDKFRAK